MPREPQALIEEMVLACEKILRLTEGRAFSEVSREEAVWVQMLFNLIVLGEAARQVPAELRGPSASSRPWAEFGKSGRSYAGYSRNGGPTPTSSPAVNPP